ncbi:nucleoside phosphatase family-domain-containing protein [Phascolomyces articulosus]|uniref:Nucleoside phosphatase family-domain-containing protein n=1 Tax=Phascolomyces articulosus TaxID=60185 RepID=A0AAD5PKN6_9FUNG|nr:nucleoside phosphatase family-domain-containing protein [Phascolomyces articulosus]
MREHLLVKRHAAFAPRQEPSIIDDVDEPWENNRRYGVVIDAGSSGSRVYVYSWKDHEHVKSTWAPEELKGSIPIVERGDQLGLKWTRREEPGISTFGSRPQEVGEHLQLLLDFATEVVPKESLNDTPVFLMATAGMRLLPSEERSTLLKSTCSYIQNNYAFHISDCDTHIRVIPGELEGIYGWVAVNYLMGGFDTSIQAYMDGNRRQPGEQHHTFGFLDMGGASAQIAFEPEHHQREEHFEDLSRIYLHTLDGKKVEYDVFVTTFLGYGSNEARRRYLEERVKQAHMQNKSGKNLLDEHRTLHLDDPCLPPGLELMDSHSTSVPLTLHGTGSFTQCLEFTTPLLNKDAVCPAKPCLFNGVHTPDIDWSVNKFVGVSEYWYSSHDILGLGGVYDFTEYEKKATEYCQKDWKAIADEHKDMDSTDIQHHQMQCFKSAWIVNVLHEGIEIPRLVDPAHGTIPDDQELLEQSIESIESKNWSPPFQSIDTINDIQVSWTLGAMVLHVANQIPLVDSNDYQGHSTDDEGTHPIADGVELPKPHSSGIDQQQPQQPTINNETDVFDSLWSKSMSFDTMTLMIIMLFFSVFLWCIYKKVGRKRRSMEEARWEGPNGGLLGSNNGYTGSSSITPYRLASALGTALSRSTLTLRTWTSRILKGRSPSQGTNGIDVDTFSEQLDTVSINISGSGTNSPTGRPTPMATLGPSSRSQSAISMKYWSKKRYSGDSHATLFPTTNENRIPLRSSSSAVNLANRASSSSNNGSPDS